MLDQLTLGQRVTITVEHVLWPIRDRYAFYIPKTETYTGTLVHQPWFESNEIGITTDLEWLPFRRIKINRIVKVGDEAVSHQLTSSENTVITVPGSKGNTYTVTKQFGKASCTCTGYSFRKTCKHLSLV